MKLYFIFLLILLCLLLLSHVHESFKVHIEGELFNPLHSISYVKNSIQSWITPVYHSAIGIIPYKHHLRRIRRSM